jgi:hypothetical protein
MKFLPDFLGCCCDLSSLPFGTINLNRSIDQQSRNSYTNNNNSPSPTLSPLLSPKSIYHTSPPSTPLHLSQVMSKQSEMNNLPKNNNQQNYNENNNNKFKSNSPPSISPSVLTIDISKQNENYFKLHSTSTTTPITTTQTTALSDSTSKRRLFLNNPNNNNSNDSNNSLSINHQQYQQEQHLSVSLDTILEKRLSNLNPSSNININDKSIHELGNKVNINNGDDDDDDDGDDDAIINNDNLSFPSLSLKSAQNNL